MKKLFLHVGMPKCASSAIQSFLSSDVFYMNNKKILYVSIESNGNLLYGKNLLKKAKKSPFGYSSSVEISHLLKMSTEKKVKILKTLLFLFEEYDTIIISNEGWGTKPQQVNSFFYPIFDEQNYFEVNLISYIRPQVEWINSAWWQWGAWSGHDLDFWMKRSLNECNWEKHIREWNEANWINRKNFRLLNSDIMQDFSNLLGINLIETKKSNQSLPSVLLRVFQKNRDFRRDAHDSSNEFILSRWIDFNGLKPTPWILNNSAMKQIIEYFYDSNKKVYEYLDSDQKEIFNRNSNWNSMDSYKNKNIESWKLENIDEKELSQLIGKSMNAIVEMEKIENLTIDKAKLNLIENEDNLLKKITYLFENIIALDLQYRQKI